jgi:hypothetical protein
MNSSKKEKQSRKRWTHHPILLRMCLWIYEKFECEEKMKPTYNKFEKSKDDGWKEENEGR